MVFEVIACPTFKPSFNPPSVTGSGSSIMTVTTQKSTSKGRVAVTISGTSGALVRTTTVALNVTK